MWIIGGLVKFDGAADGTRDSESLSTFATGISCATWRMSHDSLSKILTPIRCGSVDTELMNGHDAAK